VQAAACAASARAVAAAQGRKVALVVLNLVLNASYAIRAAAGGPHRVRVRVWSESGSTLFAVSDTGVGIAPADLPRLFDPFFSTKPVGDGVGLGLAIAQSIVVTGSGAIHVDSQPGAGATFTVTLPSV
jgi:signal transduction histidine kinase